MITLGASINLLLSSWFSSSSFSFFSEAFSIGFSILLEAFLLVGLFSKVLF